MGKKNTEAEDRYIVAPGCSFVGNKRAYNAGDEIDEKAFGKPEDFKKMLSGKKPKIIKAPPKEEAAEEKNKGGGNTGAGTADRKGLEEAVIAKGLGKPEDLAALSDDELKQLLRDTE
jgi:hypothetical protein